MRNDRRGIAQARHFEPRPVGPSWRNPAAHAGGRGNSLFQPFNSLIGPVNSLFAGQVIPCSGTPGIQVRGIGNPYGNEYMRPPKMAKNTKFPVIFPVLRELGDEQLTARILGAFWRRAQHGVAKPHPEEHREAMHLEGWMQRTDSLPSFETRILRQRLRVRSSG